MKSICVVTILMIIVSIIGLAPVPARAANARNLLPFVFGYVKERVEGAAVGDVNSDGLDDIVITCVDEVAFPREFYLIVYHQNQNGRLDNYVKYSMPSYHIQSVDIADINGDGLNDVVIPYEFGIAIYFQNDNLALSNSPERYTSGATGSFKLRAGDFNNDGLMDVASISFSTWDLEIFLQDPANSPNPPAPGVPCVFEDPVVINLDGTTYKDIDIGDFNRDGRDDIVLAGDQGSPPTCFAVLYQNAAGTMNTAIYPQPGYLVGGCAAGDLNGDTTDDIYISCWRDSWTNNFTTAVYYGITGGTVADPPTEFPLSVDGNYPIHPVVITTIDNDSRKDAVALQAETLSVFHQQAGGSLAEPPDEYDTPYAVALNAHSMTSGDVNNDGRQDVIIANYNFGATILYGSDTTDAAVVVTPNGHYYGVGDQVYISWATNTDTVSAVDLFFSADGMNWQTIITDLTESTYRWLVPTVNSNSCLIRVVAPGGLIGESVIPFAIIDTGPVGLSVTSPNGGESLWIGEPWKITWTTSGAVGNVTIEFSPDNGGTWQTIAGNVSNSGSYNWTVPDIQTTQGLIQISETSDGDPTDISDNNFTIEKATPTLVLTSPLGGEHWKVGNQHFVTWNSIGDVGDIKVEYSYDDKVSWHTVASPVSVEGGLFYWTIPNTPSDTCFVRISGADDGEPSSENYKAFSIVTGSEGPAISLSRTQLYFAAIKASPAHTANQYVIVNNSGAGTLYWQAEEITNNANWLRLYNSTGTQSGTVEIAVEPFGLTPRTYNAVLRFTGSDASTAPRDVDIRLNVYEAGGDADPFGSFDTPLHGSTVTSSVPVTGWALDDIGIDKVTIWRNSGAPGGDKAYIGDAVLVEGARPDVEQAYPGYPMNYQAGWGYMMLTNMLPNGGNGTFTLYAYAKDVAGHEVLLGSKTIYCDNAQAVKPFGAIDTPTQGGTASGDDFRNQGWVLTPMPNKVPVNGSTIHVYVDGQSIGNPYYNVYRDDIARLFPGYANSSGSMALLDFDTTAYESGVHTIQWTAADNAGNTDGIGSRYFNIRNTGFNRQSATAQKSRLYTNANAVRGKIHRFSDLFKIPVNFSRPVTVKKGFRGDNSGLVAPGTSRLARITAPQDERVVLQLTGPGEYIHTGYLVNGTRLYPLPPGSSMDRKNGIFYWQVGPGYLGNYKLVFILENQAGLLTQKNAHINVVPKFRKK